MIKWTAGEEIVARRLAKEGMTPAEVYIVLYQGRVERYEKALQRIVDETANCSCAAITIAEHALKQIP